MTDDNRIRNQRMAAAFHAVAAAVTNAAPSSGHTTDQLGELIKAADSSAYLLALIDLASTARGFQITAYSAGTAAREDDSLMPMPFDWTKPQ